MWSMGSAGIEDSVTGRGQLVYFFERGYCVRPPVVHGMQHPVEDGFLVFFVLKLYNACDAAHLPLLVDLGFLSSL